jgi:digeranylgeranylglycerophospholipid reductase
MHVSIIGASTSGLFTAYLLAQEGVEVELFDQADRLGDVSRTLIVTDHLRQLHEFPEELILGRVRRYELFSRSRSAALELGRPDLVVERGRLIRYLEETARKAGARIHLGQRMTGFERQGERVRVRVQDVAGDRDGREFLTDVLVGADGGRSRVAEGMQRSPRGFSALLQARVRMPDWAGPEKTQVWFYPEETPYFYWLIPESNRTAVVGLIAEERGKAEAALKRFLAEKDLSPEAFESGFAPIHRIGLGGRGLGIGGNVFLVGDAAAQVKVTTVGGLVTGLAGARSLTRAILDGRHYRRESRELRRELNLHAVLRQMLNRLNPAQYDHLLELLNGPLQGVLKEWTRDELNRSWLKLIRAEPRLLLVGMKAFARGLF